MRTGPIYYYMWSREKNRAMGAATTSAMTRNPAQPMHLKPHERLTVLRPEFHVRRSREGEYPAYLCEDRVAGRVILTQKLPELATYISSMTDASRTGSRPPACTTS